MRRSLTLSAAALLVAGVISAVLTTTPASAADCAAAWSPSKVYTGGVMASYNGHNWSAKWWTQNETPGTADVWADKGTCGGGGGPTDPPDP